MSLYSASTVSGTSLLVAEPQAIIRMSLLAELRVAGFLPLGVGTYAFALDAAKEGDFATAIVECVFEGEAPGELVARLKSEKPSLPIICTTSFAYRSIAFECGADTVIEKPYLYSYLVQCAAAHILSSQQ